MCIRTYVLGVKNVRRRRREATRPTTAAVDNHYRWVRLGIHWSDGVRPRMRNSEGWRVSTPAGGPRLPMQQYCRSFHCFNLLVVTFGRMLFSSILRAYIQLFFSLFSTLSHLPIYKRDTVCCCCRTISLLFCILSIRICGRSFFEFGIKNKRRCRSYTFQII